MSRAANLGLGLLSVVAAVAMIYFTPQQPAHCVPPVPVILAAFFGGAGIGFIMNGH